MTTIRRIALALVIIGAINWGLIGFFQFDLVASLFGGQDSALSRVVYSLVGISGLYCLSILFSPMGDEDASINTGRVNYGTEFGEDADFSESDYYDRESWKKDE